MSTEFQFCKMSPADGLHNNVNTLNILTGILRHGEDSKFYVMQGFGFFFITIKNENNSEQGMYPSES